MIFDKETGKWKQRIIMKGEQGKMKIVKWSCDCPDFIYRKLVKDSSGKTHAGFCKHLILWINSIADKNMSLENLLDLPVNIAEIQKKMLEPFNPTELSEKIKGENTPQVI